jgi:peptidoglycan hydrolase-like protein with peptidoglycan-binding domain
MAARRTVVVTGVVAAGAVVAAVTVFNLPKSDGEPDSAGRTPSSTALITQQTLVDRESHDGTLAHGEGTSVWARTSGTVTALPEEGATVSRGKAIFRLDGKPVTLLYGSLPAYRTLKTGVKGKDVKQFEENLRALGYRGFTPDTYYNWATASAVEKWQGDLKIKKTGSVEPGQIVYADGTVRVDSLKVERGAMVGPGTAIAKVTGTSPLATVVLDANSGPQAVQGAAVQVTMSGGKVVPGKIKKVESIVAKGGDGQSSATKYQVTISFDDQVKSQSGSAAVTVAFTAGRRPNVLAVPVAALVASPEGGYGVQVVDDRTTRFVRVDTGLFADGKVEITGSGIKPGMKVAVPS